MGWQVHLSNNEVISQDEEEVGHWRQLSHRCKKEGLKIKSITYDGEDPHPNTPVVEYFVLYDVFVPNVLQGGTIQHVKIGIGGFYKDTDRCRIKWYRISGEPCLHTEIMHHDTKVYREFSIPRDMEHPLAKCVPSIPKEENEANR